MRSASVSKLSQPEEKVVATAFSLIVGVSDNSQITFQSGFEGDESDDVVNARVDRIMRIANRQRAIAEIPKLEGDLLEQQERLSQIVEDRDRLTLNHPILKAQREVEIEERVRSKDAEKAAFDVQIVEMIKHIQNTRDIEFNAGMEEFRRGGKTGSYAPRGLVQTNLAKIDSAIEAATKARERDLTNWELEYDQRIQVARDEIAKKDAEFEQALANYAISVTRYTDAIAVGEQKLTKARELAGG